LEVEDCQIYVVINQKEEEWAAQLMLCNGCVSIRSANW
jgi:hypothetical protein